jgi:hypothetical protein
VSLRVHNRDTPIPRTRVGVQLGSCMGRSVHNFDF